MKVFGKNPKAQKHEKIKSSSHYKDGSFYNIEKTEMMLEGVSFFKVFREFLKKHPDVKPPKEMPSVKTDLKQLSSDEPTVVWFGHSSYFITCRNFRVLVDPVLNGYASPFSFTTHAFKGADVYKPEDFPDIDLLVITHDHYDHMDYPTLKKLFPRVKNIVTSLGVKSHLEYWRAQAGSITELDWNESTQITNDVKITATPARHFSGRGLKRAQTLWSSFVLDIYGYKIFLGGDSGYGQHFADIGKEHGPFDLALLECGQYGKNWPYIHMLPEQTVLAALDLKTKVLFPVHWGKFVLSTHPWNESIKRVHVAGKEKNLPMVSPKIGEPYTLGNEIRQETWWE